MNPFQRALIEKTGHDYGFEYVLSGSEGSVNLASARQPAKVAINLESSQFALSFTSPAHALLNAELMRSFPAVACTGESFIAPDQDTLAALLRRAAELAHALPNQASHDFDARLQQELAELPADLKGTEVERVVRQRVGQQAFRSAMLDYWGGSCALTGIALPELLRASHAKPWAECASDIERLDVFNGFLLSANLDALFDRFLISFSDTGGLLISARISSRNKALLGLELPLQLRWIVDEHLPYLRYHRSKFV
ncbi:MULTISPECIES: HNH endonuclease [unclassified Halomonas]|uniref:HNH endonuclease n=1 Tax=unclassified Halomonas TaxID=2609666 RepID=UPI0007DA357B|nr:MULTISPECIES: HNH endonuclease [unclassified Halomonas]MBT2788017.1 HNH endonuclease [Halomonas sp. ISL-106]MBT2795766.1 HNH endonuclease [Halomonas sp. ISL-104]OAL61060.1 restriction endonuclease [Halomonas sp. ALS9]